MKNKKGNALLLGVIIFAAVLLALGASKLNWKLPGVVGGESGEPTCTGGNTFSFTLKGRNKYTGAANTDNFSWRIVGQTVWTEGTLGTAITAGMNPGDDIEVVVGPSPSSETGDVYGPRKVFESIQCRSVHEVEVVDDTLYTDMTGTFYNADENNAAQDGDADDAGDWVSIKWMSASDEEAGNRYGPKEYPNVVCFNLNSSQHEVPKARVNGVNMNRVSTPTVHSAEAGKVSYCFEAPIFTDAPLKYYMYIDPKSGMGSVCDEDSTAYLYSGGYAIHSDTAELLFDVETDDGNFIGFTAADQVTIDLTP